MSESARLMANSVDPDQTPHFAASDLGLPCLLRFVCPNTHGILSKQKNIVNQDIYVYYAYGLMTKY